MPSGGRPCGRRTGQGVIGVCQWQIPTAGEVLQLSVAVGARITPHPALRLPSSTSVCARLHQPPSWVPRSSTSSAVRSTSRLWLSRDNRCSLDIGSTRGVVSSSSEQHRARSQRRSPRVWSRTPSAVPTNSTLPPCLARLARSDTPLAGGRGRGTGKGRRTWGPGGGRQRRGSTALALCYAPSWYHSRRRGLTGLL